MNKIRWVRETISMPESIAIGLKIAKKHNKKLTKWRILENGLYASGFALEKNNKIGFFEWVGNWILIGEPTKIISLEEKRENDRSNNQNAPIINSQI